MSYIETSAVPPGIALAQSIGIRRTLPYALLALISGCYLYPFVRVLTGTPDDGVFLYGAQAVTWGAIPSRDFVEPQGPGSFYWLGLFFKVFGTSLFTARTVLLFSGVATTLVIFHLARRIGGTGIFPALFVLATSIPLMVMNSPHYDSNLFGLLCLSAFIRAESRARPAFFAVSGVFAGLTTCFIQQKGLYLAISLMLTLLMLHGRRGVRSAALVLVSFCSVAAVELLLYAGAHALPDLIYANFIWPFSTYQSINAASYGFLSWQTSFSSIRAHFSPLSAWVQICALTVPYLLILVVPLALPLLSLFSRRTAFRREILPYWMAGYALWVSELHRLDFGHLRNGCLLLIVLFFTLCGTGRNWFLKQMALVVMGCLVLDATANVLAATSVQTPVPSRRGTLYELGRDTALEFLLAHTKPGEDVFVYPYQPIYYFLADVRNPTRYSYLIYHFNTNAQFREAIHDLEVKKVRYVLWDMNLSGQNMTAVFPAYRHPPAGELIMEPYLESHYHQIGFEKGFRILERTN